MNDNSNVSRIVNEVQTALDQESSSCSSADNQVCLGEDEIGLDLTIEHNNSDLSTSILNNSNQNQLFEFGSTNSSVPSSLINNRHFSDQMENRVKQQSNQISLKTAKSDNNLSKFESIENISHLRQASIDSSMCPITIGNQENDLEAVSNLYNKMLINNQTVLANEMNQQHSASSTTSSTSSMSLNSSSSTQLSSNSNALINNNETSLIKKTVIESLEESESSSNIECSTSFKVS